MPLITLTSDIGQQNFLAGAIKGQLLQANPGFTLIDITHSLSPFNYPQAAYVCRSAIKNFPPNTFHLLLMNLFHEKSDHLLLVKHKDQYIGCADNGIITMILEEVPADVVALPLDKSAPKNALHYAAVFAKAINDILSGKSFEDTGDPKVSIQLKSHLVPFVDNNYIEGQIIFIDNFENVIVNISQQQFEEQRRGRNFKIVFKRDEVIDKISESYYDVAGGEKLALFNAAGYLEIAINKGNAAGLFGLQGYSEKPTIESQYLQNKLLYETIKVYFE